MSSITRVLSTTLGCVINPHLTQTRTANQRWLFLPVTMVSGAEGTKMAALSPPAAIWCR